MELLTVDFETVVTVVAFAVVFVFEVVTLSNPCEVARSLRFNGPLFRSGGVCATPLDTIDKKATINEMVFMNRYSTSLAGFLIVFHPNIKCIDVPLNFINDDFPSGSL